MEDNSSKEVENKVAISETTVVDQDVFDKYKQFLEKEFQGLQKSKDQVTQEEYERRRDDFVVQNDGRRLIRYIISVPSEVEGFAHMASKGNEPVGFSVVAISKDKKEVVGEFVGRAYTEQHQGIASDLLKARHKELMARGITEYESGMTDEARSLFEKIGVKTELIKENDMNQKFYKVTLR